MHTGLRRDGTKSGFAGGRWPKMEPVFSLFSESYFRPTRLGNQAIKRPPAVKWRTAGGLARDIRRKPSPRVTFNTITPETLAVPVVARAQFQSAGLSRNPENATWDFHLVVGV